MAWCLRVIDTFCHIKTVIHISVSLRAINCAILKVHRAGENTKTEERLRAGAVGEEKSNLALGCPDSAVIMPTSGLSITPGFQQTTVWPQHPGNKGQTMPYSISTDLWREKGSVWFCSGSLLRAPHKPQFFIFDTLTLCGIKQEAKSKGSLAKINQPVHTLLGVLAAAPHLNNLTSTLDPL